MLRVPRIARTTAIIGIASLLGTAAVVTAVGSNRWVPDVLQRWLDEPSDTVTATVPGPTGPVVVEGDSSSDSALDPTGRLTEREIVGPAGPIGPQGPRGERGLRGPIGPVGPQGSIGATGEQGLVGAQGPTGTTGPVGPTGAPGPQGIQGPAGPKGDTGAIGPVGPVGATGPQGPTGAQGPAGPAGADGAAGPQGPAGEDAQLGPYGSFFDVQTQPNTTPGQPLPVFIRSSDPNATDGVTIANGSQLVVDSDGVYDIQFSFQITKTSSGNDTAYVWLRKNGDDVPTTNTGLYLVGKNDKAVFSLNFFVQLNAGENAELMWLAEDATVAILYVAPSASPVMPAIPSAIVTIEKIGG